MEQDKPDVRDRIKTFEDVLRDNQTDYYALDLRYGDLSKDEFAYVKLKLIAKSLNEGWEPNCNSISEMKYYPMFDMGGSPSFRCVDYDYWVLSSGVGSRLCFKSRELAEYAGTQFLDVYKDFMML